MTNIVLYRVALTIGILMAVTMAKGQKPAIDLLPSSHQYMHPAALIDTSSKNDTLAHIIPVQISPAIHTDSISVEKEKKKDFKFGLDLDSILKNGEVRKVRVNPGSGLISLLIKNINPLKLFIHITALN